MRQSLCLAPGMNELWLGSGLFKMWIKTANILSKVFMWEIKWYTSMVALRDGISLLVFNSISHSFASLTCEISSWTLWEISYFHALLYYSLFIWLFSQVVDYAEYGNLRESMPNQSVPSLVQTVTQLASALEYLENKNMKHLKLSGTSIFVVKPGKVWNGPACVHLYPR